MGNETFYWDGLTHSIKNRSLIYFIISMSDTTSVTARDIESVTHSFVINRMFRNVVPFARFFHVSNTFRGWVTTNMAELIPAICKWYNDFLVIPLKAKSGNTSKANFLTNL